MPLSPGTRLWHDNGTSLLGEGGMSTDRRTEWLGAVKVRS